MIDSPPFEIALREQAEVPLPAPPVGEILVEQEVERTARESRSIRVDVEKLDELTDFVDELVVAGDRATRLSRQIGNAESVESIELMARLIEQLRDGAMRLRMVRIGETFLHLRRVVRDVGRSLGKDIELIIEGAKTELDKVLLEKLTDPLTHLVQNSLDHGIEPAALRRQSGKPERGTLRISAFHESGSVIIEVSDDGGGLRREPILRRAREHGLVRPDEALSDAELCGLIFRPGFSTAEKVTDLSGRGVGMGLVRRNIESLRGHVEVHSIEGKGTTTRIRLPLTVAIMDGLLVTAGATSFVVPLDSVVECVPSSEKGSSDGGSRHVSLRGEAFPCLVLRDLFGASSGQAPAPPDMVIVQVDGRKVGLIVDQILCEFQTVIKPVGRLFQNLLWLAGATLLGSGEVALILDVPVLVRHSSRLETQPLVPTLGPSAPRTQQRSM